LPATLGKQQKGPGEIPALFRIKAYKCRHWPPES
jgi:hypothetical protein